MTPLHNKLRLLRLARNWNQEDIAGQLGISISAYSKIENGITDMNLSRLQQLAGLYDLSVVQLFAGEMDHAAADQLVMLEDRVADREKELILLQEKVISLFEEIRSIKRA